VTLAREMSCFILTVLALLALDVGIDGVRDELIGAAGLMLVDHRGPLAVVDHASRQVPEPGAARLCALRDEGRPEPIGAGAWLVVPRACAGGECCGREWISESSRR